MEHGVACDAYSFEGTRQATSIATWSRKGRGHLPPRSAPTSGNNSRKGIRRARKREQAPVSKSGLVSGRPTSGAWAAEESAQIEERSDEETSLYDVSPKPLLGRLWDFNALISLTAQCFCGWGAARRGPAFRSRPPRN